MENLPRELSVHELNSRGNSEADKTLLPWKYVFLCLTAVTTHGVGADWEKRIVTEKNADEESPCRR